MVTAVKESPVRVGMFGIRTDSSGHVTHFVHTSVIQRRAFDKRLGDVLGALQDVVTGISPAMEVEYLKVGERGKAEEGVRYDALVVVRDLVRREGRDAEQKKSRVQRALIIAAGELNRP